MMKAIAFPIAIVCLLISIPAAAQAATVSWSADDVVRFLWGTVTVLLGILWADLRKRLNVHESKVSELEISLARVETQIARMVSDIESEKRTRSEVNRLMFDKLDRLWERSGRKRSEDAT